jgi:MFS family permease
VESKHTETPDQSPISQTTENGSPDTLTAWTLVAACLAVCVAQIALAMPATLNGLFQADLHPVGTQLTWISDAFLLPTAVLELTFGVLGDLFGRRRLLLYGGALIVIGAIVSATAGAVHQLWLGQALTGLGAAALFPTSLAAIAAGTGHGRSRARGIASWSGALAVGAMAAPLLGGLAGTYGSWQDAFTVLAILGGVSTLLSLKATNSSAPQGRSLDWGGQITLAVGLFALLYAVIDGGNVGWSAPAVVGGFIAAAVFLGLFLLAEHRTRAPMLRLDLFRNPAFAGAAAVALIGMFAYLGTAYSISIRMSAVQGQSSLRTAVPFLLLNGATPLLGPVMVRALQRVDPRLLLGGSLVFMAAGDFWLAALPISDGTIPSLLAPFILVGIGFAGTLNAITAAAVNTVPVRLAGMASGATSMMRDFGQTLGPAIIGSIALGHAAASFSSRLASAGLSPAQLGAVTAVNKAGGTLAVVAVGGPDPKSPVAAGVPSAVAALGQGYGIGFAVCGIGALLAAAVAVLLVRGLGNREPATSTAPATVPA